MGQFMERCLTRESTPAFIFAAEQAPNRISGSMLANDTITSEAVGLSSFRKEAARSRSTEKPYSITGGLPQRGRGSSRGRWEYPQRWYTQA